MVTDCLDAGALIKFAVDELTIHKAICQAVQLAFAEHELVGIELLCLGKVALVVGNEHDLIQRFSFVIGKRQDGHALFHGFAPAFRFAVQRCIVLFVDKFPPLSHLASAKGGIPGFQRALHAIAFQRRAHAFSLLRFHGDIHQSLAIAQHIAAGAAHCARKAVVPQQRFGHAVVAAGAQKQFVSVCSGAIQCSQSAFRDEHITRRQQRAVNIQKNQLTTHTFILYHQREPRSTI